MNTYIQDKLDELIKNYRKENVIEGSRAYFTEYDARMVAERLATDYHNHIVEKINSIDPTKSNNAIDHHIKIKSLLQDTNPSGEYEKALDNHFPGIQDSLDKLTIRDTNQKE